jgi:type IV secretion system protein TrbL
MSVLSLPISIGTNALFSALVHWGADGAQLAVRDVIGSAIIGTTTVDLGRSSWLSSVTRNMFGVEELIMAPLLFAATIGAVLRQDMRRLARSWGVYLPISMLAGYAVVELTKIGLDITDAVSSTVQYEVMPNLGTVLVKAISLGIVASVNDGILSVVLSLLIIGGCLAVWLELAVRAAAIEVAVFFMPLALAGLVWPATAHWAKRLIEVLVALLLMKPVIVGALCLGAGAVVDVGGPSTAVTGLAILLIAAFAPYALLKLVPMVGVSAIAHLEGLSRQPLRAAEQTVQRALTYFAQAGAASSVVAESGGLPAGAGQMMAQLGAAGAGGAENDRPVANPYGPAGDPALFRATSEGDAGHE